MFNKKHEHDAIQKYTSRIRLDTSPASACCPLNLLEREKLWGAAAFVHTHPHGGRVHTCTDGIRVHTRTDGDGLHTRIHGVLVRARTYAAGVHTHTHTHTGGPLGVSAAPLVPEFDQAVPAAGDDLGGLVRVPQGADAHLVVGLDPVVQLGGLPVPDVQLAVRVP